MSEYNELKVFTLKKGTKIKIKGFPFWLIEDAKIEAKQNNFDFVMELVAQDAQDGCKFDISQVNGSPENPKIDESCS